MIRRSLLAAAAAVAALFATPAAFGVVILDTVSTYDAATNANTVDSAAPNSTGNAATFIPLVATAHAANLGGVVDFDTGAVNPAADTAFDFRYGAGLAKTLRVTTNVLIDPVNSVDPSTGTISPISGAGVLTNQTGGNFETTFNFGTITGGAPGEAVTTAAFTLLARNNYGATGQDFTVTATFSGGGTQVSSTNISNVKGADDTFFWFQAPVGQSITSILVDNVSATQVTSTPAYDDFAFITSVVPEPAALTLLALAATPLLTRRRR